MQVVEVPPGLGDIERKIDGVEAMAGEIEFDDFPLRGAPTTRENDVGDPIDVLAGQFADALEEICRQLSCARFSRNLRGVVGLYFRHFRASDVDRKRTRLNSSH